MGFRFRKNINLGGGFKINLSKSGVGYSWGTKSVRYTNTATGKKRTTVSIPGTGISYVIESGRKKRPTTRKSTKTESNFSAQKPNNTENGESGMVWTKFIICLFFGYLGVHKFMEKKIGIGFVYLFTVGLFGFGWLYDWIKYLIIAIKSSTVDSEEVVQYKSNANTATGHPPVEISVRRGFSIKKVLLWVLTIFLALIALAFLPHISGIIALVAVCIVIPIEKWQQIITRFIKGRIKTITVTAMAVLAFFTAPTANTQELPQVDPVTVVAESTETIESVTTSPTSIATTEAITNPSAVPPAAVERITFYEGDYVIGVGRTVNIPFALYPANAIISTLEAFVDNAECAILSLDRKDDHIIQITGVIPGEATVTLKSEDTIFATANIIVEEVMPEALHIVVGPQDLRIGTVGVFTVEFDPLDVTKQDVVWQSDTPQVLTVNEDGSYEAHSVGKATITATHENGVIGTVSVEVLPIEVASIVISTNWEDGHPFCRNDSMTLTAEIYPENAADKSITWTTSDESVATVSDKGVVKAISVGSATITATSSNGKQDHYTVSVEPSPQNFRVSTSISMKSNDHVGSKWSTGFEFNSEPLRNGNTVSIMVGDSFTVAGWAEENDSRSDYGSYREQLTLTDEMCRSGFTVEGEVNVFENGGRYSGNCATWYVKIKFTPVN